MRIKNATFIQKHLEKVVLAGALLFLVIVLAIYIGGLWNPYKVEVGSREYDNPADVIPALMDGAENIDSGLRAGDQIDEAYVAPDMETNYRGMLGQPVVSVSEPRLARSLSQSGTPLSALNLEMPPPPVYNVPSPPMPGQIAWKMGNDVLDTNFDQGLNAEFANLWGGMRDPADFTYVIVEGEFSMYDWAEALTGEPGESGKIPYGIWSTRLFATAVYIVREEYDPQSGQWINRVAVKPMPDQIQVMPDEKHDPRPERAAQLISEIEQFQQDVLNPILPPVKISGTLTLPKDDLDPDGLNMEFDRFDDPALRGEPMNEQERKRLERRERMEERRREREMRRRQRNNGGDEFRDPGFDGPNERDMRRQRELEERRRQQQIEEQRRQAAEERERMIREQERLRREQERNFGPGFGDGFGGGFGGGGSRGALNLDPEAVTRVWAVDVTAEAGKTYRYKLAVAVVNPLYGVPRLDPKQKSENAEKASLGPNEEVMEDAEWVGPVAIPAKYEFFYVGGSESRSRVEIWTTYNGQIIKQEFEVSAGDPIGGAIERQLPELGNTRIDLSVDAIVVDVERRSDVSGRVTYAMIYVDQYGILHERVQSEDQTATRRRDLEKKLEEQRNMRDRDAGFNDNFDRDFF